MGRAIHKKSGPGKPKVLCEYYCVEEMMISYPGLSKLKTKPVVYGDVFSASDSGTLEQLKELSSKRKSMEDSINESSFVTEAIAREMSGGLTSRCEQDIQKLECYLPLLENLVHHINYNGKNRQLNCWISKLQLRWSSGLTQPSVFNIHGPKFYQVDDLYFELGMSLFLYGALLRVRAHEILSSDMVQSATLFRKAAGVYNYLSHEILINLNLINERPPEAMHTVSSIMSLVCLAEAQAVTARKAEENGNRGGLLAKLHCGVKEFLVEAINILQVAAKECKDISSRFLDFILSGKTLHESMSYKYHAEGLKNDGKIGIAIGFLRQALAEAKKSIPKEESWKLVFKRVIDELTVLLQKYEHENEFVWHEKVAREHELTLPQAVKIVSLVPYQPQIWERTLVFKY
ncbi:apoptosis-linked gene 2-interacting protein x 1 [Phtheirospermum japonicum]|uniref:Apoptosis-linked gene 2-interacting protein x 1 n=1 Tax=Phtheirospermum japonicum TaxID=374723 RepID=A0A830CQJ3_9LAMI|nr:apoptosis-linked gene 2-interacting protein x 1 [Phtheirospermum japonicum]